METITNKQDERTANCEAKENTAGNNILVGDKEYIEEYFKICELYQKKRILLNQSKGDLEAVNKEISVLNSVIKEKEAMFWPRVKDALAKGNKFTVEKTTSLYGLDAFEKKILLFFLYLEFFYISQNLCSEDMLLKIFDLDNSIIWKMCALKYFHRDSNLLKYHILCQIFKNNGSSSKAILALSSYILDSFSKMISGGPVESKPGKKKEGKVKDISPCEEVGFLKKPVYCLEDVKLSNEIKGKISFFLSGSQNKRLKDLGVQETIRNSKGLVFLFYGPPGTGKSMLAEAVAKQLKKNLLIVEFPKVTSRWFGDTDKNISTIFKSAKEHRLVICIDEADSLLYNRNFAVQEHDIRFVNVMLQEIERFEGEIILTTNMDNLLDPALERRVSLKVKFGLPDEKLRAEIWRSHIPSKVSLEQGVDLTILARQFEFSGGYIKNAALHALRRLAQEKRNAITMEDLLFGARLEQEGIFVKENKSKIGFFAQA